MAHRTFLTGADLILPDRIASGLTLVIEADRIIDLATGANTVDAHDRRIDISGHLIAPGFVDAHVHGIEGIDTLDGPGAVAAIAARMPRRGVTAFCPTTVACAPAALTAVLREIAALRARPGANSARVLPAHLESNFLNPDFRGAQPAACLRSASSEGPKVRGAEGSFSANDVLSAIDAHRPDIATVTLASEIDGGLDLIRRLATNGLRVSLGHSGATFDQALEAIEAGARQVTHLFNAMRPLGQREPGLAGAALVHDEVAAELICDGHHVHAATVRLAMAAKGPGGILAVTDGTAGSGLPAGTQARLGGLTITVRDTAVLEDGTMAGSVLTMDRAFAKLVTLMGADLVRAAHACATTPARELGLQGHGVLAPGAVADLVVLTRNLEVAQTWIGGACVWEHAGGSQRLQ